MKPNSYRMWSIQFRGDGDFYHAFTAHETFDAMLGKVDEEEDEIDWQVNSIVITAMTGSGKG